MDLLEQLSKPGAAAFPAAMTTLVLAFVLAQIVAGVYIITFRGMSYSRSFVQAIPLGAAGPPSFGTNVLPNARSVLSIPPPYAFLPGWAAPSRTVSSFSSCFRLRLSKGRAGSALSLAGADGGGGKCTSSSSS